MATEQRRQTMMDLTTGGGTRPSAGEAAPQVEPCGYHGNRSPGHRASIDTSDVQIGEANTGGQHSVHGNTRSDGDSASEAAQDVPRNSDVTVETRAMPAERVVIEICGERFVTLQATLNRRPYTRLGSLSRGDEAYDPVLGHYFFDRDPRLFSFVLDYCRTGYMHFPHNLCGPLLKSELQFWQIPERDIAPCCWRAYRDFEDEAETLLILDTAFHGHARAMKEEVMKLKSYGGWRKWKRKIWLFLEDPTSSLHAQMWSYTFILLLILSVAVVVLESHPTFRVRPAVFSAQRNHSAHTETNPKLKLYLNTDTHPVLQYIDYSCTIVFAVELVTKFCVWPHKLTFFKYFYNIIDILSVVPMIVLNTIDVIHPAYWFENNLTASYIALSTASVLRAVRILKLIKHNRGLQIIFLAIKASSRELFLLFILMCIGMLIFSTMIYYAEFSEQGFESVPIGFWWSIVTMTTVGYGDVVPTSPLGYFIGSLCAVMGMLGTGLPIPVIANSFYWYYKYARVKEKMEEKRDLDLDQTPCQKLKFKDRPGPTSSLSLDIIPSDKDERVFPRPRE